MTQAKFGSNWHKGLWEDFKSILLKYTKFAYSVENT